MKSIGGTRVEVFIGTFLRYGVLSSALVLSLGIALSFLYPTQLEPLPGELFAQLSRGEMLSSVAALFPTRSLGPGSFLSLGLLMLIALPILRVALTLVLFLREGDFIYVGLSATVLCLLLLGLFFGKSL